MDHIGHVGTPFDQGAWGCLSLAVPVEGAGEVVGADAPPAGLCGCLADVSVSSSLPAVYGIKWTCSNGNSSTGFSAEQLVQQILDSHQTKPPPRTHNCLCTGTLGKGEKTEKAWLQRFILGLREKWCNILKITKMILFDKWRQTKWCKEQTKHSIYIFIINNYHVLFRSIHMRVFSLCMPNSP